MKHRQPHPDLAAALRSLAAQDADSAPPPELEAGLLAEFSRSHRDATVAPAGRRIPVWIAVAATSAMAGLMVIHQRPPEPKFAEAPFVQVPFVAPPAPYERVEMVHQSVPIAALIAAGFEVHVADAGDALPADVLVGQDGRALAIRLARGNEPRGNEQ